MSRGDYCTYCGMAGHRASQCPARVLTPSLARLLGAWGKKARRLVCALWACKREYRGYNLMGRHDQEPRGVFECSRCGRVTLGRAQ